MQLLHRTHRRSKTRAFSMFAALLGVLLMSSGAALLATAGSASATPGDDHKQSVCHPVNGEGELGNGWNLIPPDKASSHIDETTGAPKHVTKDGRHDQLADSEGNCPGPVQDEVMCPSDSDHPTRPADGSEGPCDDPDEQVVLCASDSDHPTRPADGSEGPCNDPEEQVCPEGTDHQGEDVTPCDDEKTVVDPPTTPTVVSPPTTPRKSTPAKAKTTKVATTTTTPSVVHAGLASDLVDTAALRTQQGLALLVAGALVLMAGGLGMTRRRGEHVRR